MDLTSQAPDDFVLTPSTHEAVFPLVIADCPCRPAKLSVSTLSIPNSLPSEVTIFRNLNSTTDRQASAEFGAMVSEQAPYIWFAYDQNLASLCIPDQLASAEYPRLSQLMDIVRPQSQPLREDSVGITTLCGC
jgi:hypothetical protein